MAAERWIITPGAREHVLLLAERLRSGDRKELQDCGLSPNGGVWRSYRRSLFCRTLFVDGEIGAMWGCGGSIASGIGEPWLLTSSAVERAPISCVKIARDEAAKMLTTFRKLSGYVAADYDKAVRLLDVMGFDLSAAFPFGPKQALFRRYERAR